MPWVRIDDQFPQHPKIAKVGPLGLALQIAGLCYCNRYLTDGFIPNEVLNSLLTGCSTLDLETTAKKLIEAQVWEKTEGGIHIHDYLDYQPSKAQVTAERERNRIAGRISAQQRVQRSVDTVSTRTQAQAQARTPVPIPSTPPHPTQQQLSSQQLLDSFSLDEHDALTMRFPDIDLAWEAQKCLEWWSTSKKTMKRPKLAFCNWLEKAKLGTPAFIPPRPLTEADMEFEDKNISA